MKAMIFSAGLGTRLMPLTENLPKALAPIGDTTLLGYNLMFLKEQGVKSFIINTHHFADKIAKYLEENNNFGLDIYVSHEKELLDTAGGLANVSHLLNPDSSTLLYNVDIISNIDVKKMFEFHNKQKSDFTLAVRNRQSSRYLIFSDNRMIGWRNTKTGEEIIKSKAIHKQDLAFSGISIVNNSIVKNLTGIGKMSLVQLLLDGCSESSFLSYNHTGDYWFDCGTVKKLRDAESYVLSKA